MESANKINVNNFSKKLLRGTLSNKEKEKLRTYINSCYKDEQLDKLMQEHWESLDNLYITGKTSLDDVKMKLCSLISETQINQIKTKSRIKLNWQTHFIRIAAILIIPLLVYTGFLINRINNHSDESALVTQQVFANPGSRLHFTLPDQTEIWLNSGSSLEYPSDINKQKQRTVKLTGQGYFKVAHNSMKPFFVEVDDLKVKVIGTSFDVYNYEEDHQFISTLEEGKIALLNKNGEEVAQLKPGQQAVFNRDSNKISIKYVNTKMTTSWKDGYLIFRNSPLSEVIRVLERWYNCSIVIDPVLASSDIKYSAVIQDETLGEVLKMIEISSDVNTDLKNREVHIWAK